MWGSWSEREVSCLWPEEGVLPVPWDGWPWLINLACGSTAPGLLLWLHVSKADSKEVGQVLGHHRKKHVAPHRNPILIPHPRLSLPQPPAVPAPPWFFRSGASSPVVQLLQGYYFNSRNFSFLVSLFHSHVGNGSYWHNCLSCLVTQSLATNLHY